MNSQIQRLDVYVNICRIAHQFIRSAVTQVVLNFSSSFFSFSLHRFGSVLYLRIC